MEVISTGLTTTGSAPGVFLGTITGAEPILLIGGTTGEACPFTAPDLFDANAYAEVVEEPIVDTFVELVLVTLDGALSAAAILFNFSSQCS